MWPAVFAPTKYKDRRVGPLPADSVTLGQLEEAGVIHLSDPALKELQIVLPSKQPTLGQVMDAITKQAKLRTWYMSCGNGATLLYGGGGGRISVREQRVATQKIE